MSPVEAISVPFPPKTGKKLLHPRPRPQSLNGSNAVYVYDHHLLRLAVNDLAEHTRIRFCLPESKRRNVVTELVVSAPPRLYEPVNGLVQPSHCPRKLLELLGDLNVYFFSISACSALKWGSSPSLAAANAKSIRIDAVAGVGEYFPCSVHLPPARTLVRQVGPCTSRPCLPV